MQIEVSPYFATLLSKEVRKQKAGSESTPEPREQAGARGRTEWQRRVTVLGEQLRPDLDVAVLHRGEATVDVLLLRVGLDVRQGAIQERRIGLVLPVMLESMEVRLRCGSHAGKYADPRKWVEGMSHPTELGSRTGGNRQRPPACQTA